MTFLSEPEPSEGQRRLYEADVAQDGYVWDSSHLWAHQPELDEALSTLVVGAAEAAGLSVRDKGMLVLGESSTIGDSYCSVAWGRWLTEAEGAPTAAAALRGDEAPFTAREIALARWARKVAARPNQTTPDDVGHLREAGFDDAQIVALTVYVAARMALSLTNDALGARPDQQLVDGLDPEVRAAITWGRWPETV
jgi:alkylhydroperoxidase family enzyme